MAHFRGIIRGGRGEASRLGTKATGLSTEAQSWEGKVVVELEEKDGTDVATVWLRPHNNAGANILIYEGPVSGSGDYATDLK